METVDYERRKRALELALSFDARRFPDESMRNVLDMARAFEAYLSGDIGPGGFQTLYPVTRRDGG